LAEITSPHGLLLTHKSLIKIESLPTQKSSTQHSFTANAEIVSAYGLRLMQKLLKKIESLSTQKSSMQPLSLLIQKSIVMMW
jgi:hypothetical protein